MSHDRLIYHSYKALEFNSDVAKLKNYFGMDEIPVVKFAGIVGRPLRVLITTPFGHAELTHNYFQSLMNETGALTAAGIEVQLQPVSNAMFGLPTSCARNQLTHYFRKGAWQADVHCQLDADNGFRGNDLLRMIASEHSIVGLNCPKRALSLGGLTGEYKTQKKFNDAMLIPTIRPLPKSQQECVRGMEKVGYVGTGILVIWRKVYEDIIAAGLVRLIRFGDDWTPQTDCWRFWHYDITDAKHPLGEGYEIHEDWNFCDLARKAGHAIWCDPQAEASHMGMYCFAGLPRWPSETANNVVNSEQTKETQL